MYLEDIEKEFKNNENFKKIFFNSLKFKKEFQRYEFLGDRVLGIVLATALHEKFIDYDEGKLAKIFAFLTSSVTIEKIAKDIKLDTFLKKKKVKNISRKVLSDFMEAILGSLYLDRGLKKTTYLIIKLWEKEIKENKKPKVDSKTLLQEWSQAKSLGLPIYNSLNKIGPDHKPLFTVEIRLKKFKAIQGKGKTLQAAEKNAASLFIKKNIKDI